MKLARIGPLGAERPALYRDGRYYDLSSITDDRFFTPDRLERIRAATDVPEIDMTGQRIAAPVPRPGVVLCVGQNYAAHAAESGSEPPEHPVMFYKAPGTVIGPNDQVLIPRGSAKTDWEVELAVVIGTTARYLASPEDAAAHIAGYCLSNDVSERDFQLAVSGGQWSKGKSCETFQPLGPWLVTADEIADVQDLRLRSWVNGEPRQDSSTKDMIFSVAHLVWHLSQFTVLEPGDVINTGTPEGVALSGRFPYLRAGDVVEVEIDGLGRQRTHVGRAG